MNRRCVAGEDTTLHSLMPMNNELQQKGEGY
mgnify:FL=1|jgi:hypothetical protein